MTREWEQAVRSGDLDRLKQLRAEGADVNALDRFGQNGLMIAARLGLDATVEWLIEQGAQLDRTAKYHLSAVMLAVINGHVPVVSRLVDAGADLGIRGTGAPGFSGKTALDLATGQNRDALVSALQREPGRTMGP